MIPINKRNIVTSILLSIVPVGIYLIYWEYLLVKNVRAIQKDNSSCTGEMMCLIFVPFYSLYWWFTRGKIVKDQFASHGYSATSNENAYLVLGIFGLVIVSMAIMQNDFNSLPSEVTEVSTQSNQRSTKKVLITISVLLLIVIIVIIAIALISNNSKSNNYSSYNGYSYSTGYTDSQLESLATTALYSELSQKMLHGVSLSTMYDLGSTRYSIGSIVKDGEGWIVRGTFSLYDYYGKISSYYNCEFTVNVSEYGSTTCYVYLE